MNTTCDTCGKGFTAARSDARYCSGRCRTVAYRKNHGHDTAPVRRGPLADSFRSALWNTEKRARSLVRLTEDDRFPRNRAALAERHLSDVQRIMADLQAVADALTVTSK